jgi:hypothetical protein
MSKEVDGEARRANVGDARGDEMEFQPLTPALSPLGGARGKWFPFTDEIERWRTLATAKISGRSTPCNFQTDS